MRGQRPGTLRAIGRFAALVLASAPLVGGWFGRQRPYVDLPDSAAAIAGFLPDAAGVLVARGGERVYRFDLEGRRIVWERPARARVGLALSPGGSHVVVVEQAEAAQPARGAVLRTRDGTEVYSRDFPLRDRLAGAFRYVHEAARRFAVSEDGAWLGVALDDSAFEILDTRAGRVAFALPARGLLREIAVDVSGRRFAVHRTDRTPGGDQVVVVERRGEQWTERAALDDASWPAWAGDRLLLVGRRGLESFREGEREVLQPLDASLADELASDRGPGRFVSADGAYALVTGYQRLDLFDLRARKLAFSLSADYTPDYLALGAGFRGNRVRVFLVSGNVIEIDAATGAQKELASFGSLGGAKKTWMHEGSSWNAAYQPALAPDGRFVDIARPDEDHAVYRLDAAD